MARRLSTMGALNIDILSTPVDFNSPQTREGTNSTTKMLPGSRELPMPNVSRITNLSQAQATLLHCMTKLTKFNQEQSPSGSFAWSPVSTSNERENFQQWLERWELAFSAFLTNAMPSFTTDDITLSRVLKSNHLACTIMAGPTIPLGFDAFDNEFRAILELSGAVLRSRYAVDSPQDQKASVDLPTLIAVLDVKEPLLVVTSRCNQEQLRMRANELLSTYCL